MRSVRTIKEFIEGLIEYALERGISVVVEGNRIRLGQIDVVLEDPLEEANELSIGDEEDIWEDGTGSLGYYHSDTGETFFFDDPETAEKLYEYILTGIRNVYVYRLPSAPSNKR